MSTRNRNSRLLRSALAFSSFALFSSTQLFADTPEPVVVEVEFVVAIAITEDNTLKYGILDEALNLETIIIAPDDDAVTGTGTALVVGGVQEAGQVTITAAAGQAATVLVDNVVNNTGYTLGAFLCTYDGGTVTACDGSGLSVTTVASAVVLIGGTLTGDNAAVPGVVNGSLDINMTYD